MASDDERTKLIRHVSIPSARTSESTSCSYSPRTADAFLAGLASRRQSRRRLSVPPVGSRRQSRVRTDSICVLNDDGESVVCTSFGPVFLEEEVESSEEIPQSNCQSSIFVGWVLATISGLLFTANNFFVKYLNLDPIEILMIRSFLQTAIVAAIILIARRRLLPPLHKDKIYVMIQGLLAGVRVFLQFACLSCMPLGDALTLVFTEPLWTIFISKIFLKSQIGYFKLVFAMVLIVGMILTIQPPFMFPSPVEPATANTSIANCTDNLDHDIRLFSDSVTESGDNHRDENIPFDDTGNEHPHVSIFKRLSGLQSWREDYHSGKIHREGGNTLLKFLHRNGLSSDFLTEKNNSCNGTQPATKETYGSWYYVGVSMAIGTAISGSLANVIVAKCDSVSTSVMLFFSGLGGLIVGSIGSYMDTNNRIFFNIGAIKWDEWFILMILGASGLLGYFAMTRSLRIIPPTTVAVLRALEIVLAYIVQAAIMAEYPNWIAMIGSLFVMLSVIGFALEEPIRDCICPQKSEMILEDSIVDSVDFEGASGADNSADGGGDDDDGAKSKSSPSRRGSSRVATIAEVTEEVQAAAASADQASAQAGEGAFESPENAAAPSIEVARDSITSEKTSPFPKKAATSTSTPHKPMPDPVFPDEPNQS